MRKIAILTLSLLFGTALFAQGGGPAISGEASLTAAKIATALDGGTLTASYTQAGNLTLNGNLVQTGTLGAELVLAGDMSDASKWTAGDGTWSIAAGVATATASSSTLAQSVTTISSATWYKLVYTITASGGTVTPSGGGWTGVAASTAGTKTEWFYSGSTTALTFTAAAFTGTLDNVSLKAVPVSTWADSYWATSASTEPLKVSGELWLSGRVKIGRDPVNGDGSNYMLQLKAAAGSASTEFYIEAPDNQNHILFYHDGTDGHIQSSGKLYQSGTTGIDLYTYVSPAYVKQASIGPLGMVSFLAASVVSAPGATGTGAWYSGGSATTTKPYWLIEPVGATSTGWSTAGTGLGVNAAAGFTGNLIDFQLNGVSKFKVASDGTTTVAGGNINAPGVAASSTGYALNSTTGKFQYYGYTSAGALPAGIPVTFNASGAIAPCTSTTLPIGISAVAVTSATACWINTEGKTASCITDGAMSAGDILKVSANGSGLLTNGGAAGDWIAGIATSASTNADITQASAGWAVDDATDIITATAHGMATGQCSLYTAGGAGVIPGLTSGTYYFINKLTANTFEVCTTYANAIAGTQIDIGADGVDTDAFQFRKSDVFVSLH